MPGLRLVLRRFERGVIFTHRWLGIGVCLLLVMWFISGLVMLHVTFPRLTDDERRYGLEPIDWGLVRIAPGAALATAGTPEFPQELSLEMSVGEPVYRIVDWTGDETVVSALDGRRRRTVDAEQAVEIARRFAPVSRPAWKGEVAMDQWTFAAELNPQRPLHRVELRDPDGTELYVSARTGAVVLDTTRAERIWNWAGIIPHLFTIDEIRARPELWRGILMWTTVPSLIVALCGLWLGITRLRLIKRFPGGRVSPFRGIMKWHHLLGVMGGIFLFSWVVGGFIYLRPNHFLERVPIPKSALQRYAGVSSVEFPIDFARLTAVAPDDTRIAHFTWLDRRVYAVFTAGSGTPVVFDGLRNELGAPSEAQIIGAARRLVLTGSLARVTRLTEPDEYWHTFRLTYRKLPALRVEFADAEGQWFHIDPDSGTILNTIDRGDRAFRWIFNGLHKFDFLFLLTHGVVRDVIVWVLMLAGLALSVTSVVVGWRRLRSTSRSAA